MTDTEAKPANVVDAIARVMADLPGIGKGGKADPAQGGYAYRGIEQITAEAQTLFARHGVVFVPSVEDHQTRDLTLNNKPWTDTILRVSYTVYGPGGVEDQFKVGPLVGIGRDNSDKGANKAMTQVFKQALVQVLCIGDGKDDTDGTTHEADAVQARQAPPVPSVPLASPEDHQSIRGCIALLTELQLGGFQVWWKDQGFPSIKTQDRLTQPQADLVLDHLEKLEHDAAESAGAPDADSDGEETEAVRALANNGLLHPDEEQPLATPSETEAALARSRAHLNKPALGAKR